MLPDLDSLFLFVNAAESGSLTKAAEALHIATPAASRRLGMLEHQFRTKLFERRPRGLELTPAGSSLLRQVRTILGDVRQMQAEMANYATGRGAVVRMCVNSSALAQFLPEDIASFQQARPDIRLVLAEMWTESIIHAVRSGAAHVGVIVEGLATEGLRTYPYRSDQLAVVLPHNHELQARKLALRDIVAYDLISLESKSSLVRLVTQKAAELDCRLIVRAQVRSFGAVCSMVKAGLGVGLLPMAAAQPFEWHAQLRVVPLCEPWATRQMLLCTRDENPDPALKALITHLCDCSTCSNSSN